LNPIEVNFLIFIDLTRDFYLREDLHNPNISHSYRHWILILSSASQIAINPPPLKRQFICTITYHYHYPRSIHWLNKLIRETPWATFIVWKTYRLLISQYC
jgi:hypothetical protein